MNHRCAKFHTNIPKNMDSRNIVPFFAIFAQNLYYFTPKITILGPILLWMMAKIVS